MKTQQKKLFAFIPILIGMFSFTSTEAQIIYKDVNPDVTISCSGKIICNNTADLDLNNDGIMDFSFIVSSDHAICFPLLFSKSIREVQLNLNWVADTKITLNDIIDSNSMWYNTTRTLRDYKITCLRNCHEFPSCIRQTYNGTWSDASDGYLRLKFIVNNQVYYGWVRLSVNLTNTSASLTIKDYAYNSSQDQPILAGQVSSLSLDDFTRDNQFRIYPNPFSDAINIEFNLNQSENVSLKIFDLNGRLVTTLADKLFEAGDNNIEWNAADLTTGIYLLRFQSDKNIQAKKIIVMK